MGSRSYQTLFCWGCILLFALALVVLNEIAPLISDDYVYSFVFDAQHYHDATFSRPLTGWKDIVESQLHHSTCWSGRLVVHTLAQFFLLYGPGLLWSISNTLCFMLCVYLMLQVCVEEQQRSPWLYLLALCLYWLVMPVPGQLYFWLTGSCNYHWAALAILLFIYCWKKADDKPLFACLLYPVALLAGNSHEAITIGLGAALFLFSILRWRAMRFHQWGGVVVFFLGACTNVLSPGAQCRIEKFGFEGGIFNALFRMLRGLRDWAESLCANPTLWVIPLAAVLFLAVLLWRRRFNGSFLFALAACLSFALPLYAGDVGERAMFGVFLYSFVALLPLVAGVYNRLGSAWRIAVLAVVGAMSACGVYVAACTLREVDEFEQTIRQSVLAGEAQVHMPESVPDSAWPWGGFAHRSFILPSELSFQNRAFAAYYGLPRFGFALPEVWARMPNITAAQYESLQNNTFCRLNQDWILVRASDEPILTARASIGYIPDESLPLLTRYKRSSKGWQLRGIRELFLREHNGIPYILMQCGEDYRTETNAAQVVLEIYHGHKLETRKFFLPAERGPLVPRNE